jgi:hypothetical protein
MTLRKPIPGVYCRTCDGVGDACPTCDRCAAHARWAIANIQGYDMAPIIRWFACGRHLASVLSDGSWEVDCVQVYDLSEPVAR